MTNATIQNFFFLCQFQCSFQKPQFRLKILIAYQLLAVKSDIFLDALVAFHYNFSNVIHHQKFPNIFSQFSLYVTNYYQYDMLSLIKLVNIVNMDILSIERIVQNMQILRFYNSKKHIVYNIIIFKMQKNPGHQPQRFQVYTELPNRTGFRIPNCNHVFFFDRYNGWKDQYGNYYNADGQPDQEPDDVSDKSVSGKSWSDDEDEFQKAFGPDANVQEEFQNEDLQSAVQETIAKNMAQLEHHQKNQPLRINFTILDVQPEETLPTPKELYESYRKKVKGILNVFYDDDQEAPNNVGYFVVKDWKNAVKLIELEGKDLVGFDISFDLETFQQLLNDPIGEFQLENNFPKFVGLEQNQKLYIVELQSGGFACSKDQFNKWLGQFGLTKQNIQKMIKGENKQKKPVLKIKQSQYEKLKLGKFGDKKLIVTEYKPIVKQDKQQQKGEQVQSKNTAKQQQVQVSQTISQKQQKSA